jgi:hypothetical protein
MRSKIIPESILKYASLRYRYLDEVHISDEKRMSKTRTVRNLFYNAEGCDCLSNYRRTSKLLIINESE